MKIGARNQLLGKVTKIQKGAVMCQVKLDLIGKGNMSAVMTMDTLKYLGLKKGDKARIVVKAIHVLLIKD